MPLGTALDSAKIAGRAEQRHRGGGVEEGRGLWNSAGDGSGFFMFGRDIKPTIYDICGLEIKHI